MGAPVDHCVSYFAPKEVQRMWAAAASSGARVSHFEALLAHVWSLMMRNRELQHEEQVVNMNVTLGARRRVFPALPETYLGSPIILTRVTGTKAMSLQALANSIRSSIAYLTPSNVSALLHANAYEDSAQRLWAAFLGNRNSIITFWLRLEVYRVDFGAVILPRHAEAFLPSLDGLVQFTEVRGDDTKNADGGICERFLASKG
jgi:hypothetical protein